MAEVISRMVNNFSVTMLTKNKQEMIYLRAAMQNHFYHQAAENIQKAIDAYDIH